jgi:hypothetical protein
MFPIKAYFDVCALKELRNRADRICERYLFPMFSLRYFVFVYFNLIDFLFVLSYNVVFCNINNRIEILNLLFLI